MYTSLSRNSFRSPIVPTGLSNEQLRRFAPSVFATEPWHKVSDRYRFIPTIEVVEAMRENGMLPVFAAQSRSRIEGKQEYTKHLLRFRPSRSLLSVGDTIPEIVLVNAHDRGSSYVLDAGVFRLVCSNGMVIKSQDFGSIHVPHIGPRDLVGRVIEGSYKIIEDTAKIGPRIEEWQAMELPLRLQLRYAQRAADLRWGTDDNGNSRAPVKPEELLRVRRYQDAGPENRNLARSDVWTTFNVVQENLVKGGQAYHVSPEERRSWRSRGVRHTRAISGVGQDVSLNRDLWGLTEELVDAIRSRLAARSVV